jgi:hypothetical protein
VHAERAHQQKSVSCTSKSVAVVLRSPSGVVDFVMMCDELLIGCVSQNVNQWQRTGFQEATLAPISLQMNISWSEKILLHSIDCSVSFGQALKETQHKRRQSPPQSVGDSHCVASVFTWTEDKYSVGKDCLELDTQV